MADQLFAKPLPPRTPEEIAADKERGAEYVRQAREIEAAAERRTAARFEAEAKKAARAWRYLYGEEIAAKLEPWTSYTVLAVEDAGYLFACSSHERFKEARGEAQRHDLYADPNSHGAPVQGVEIGSRVPKLAGVDPTPDDFAKVAAEVREAAAKKAAQQAQADEQRAAVFRAQQERRKYGVAFDEIPDD